MTLLQAINVCRVYHNIDMANYNTEEGRNLLLFIKDLNDYDKTLLVESLSNIYPGNIADNKGNITVKTLVQTFTIFLNQLSYFLNSVDDQCKIIPTKNARFNKIIEGENNSRLKQGNITDYENLIDSVISLKSCGFEIEGLSHIQDLQFISIRNIKNQYKQEINRLESEGKLEDKDIEIYNTTEHTIANLKALLNYFIKSKK